MTRLGTTRRLFPARPPLLDRGHPGARNIRMAAVAQASGYIKELVTNKTYTHSLVQGISTSFGPAVQPSGFYSGGIPIPAAPALETMSQGTLSVIFSLTVSFNGAGLVGTVNGSVPSGTSAIALGTLSTPQAIGSIGVTTVFTTYWPTLILGHKYFACMNWIQLTGSSIVNAVGVLTDLTTGQYWIANGGASIGSNLAGSGNNYEFLVGCPQPYQMYAGSISAYAIPLHEMLTWARDPWSLWYKRQGPSIQFLSSRGQPVIITNNLSLTTNDALDTAAVNIISSSTAPRVSYFVDTTVLNRMKVALGDNSITPGAGNSVDGQGTAGQLVIGTSSLTPNSSTGVLATLALAFPSFSYSSRTATLLGVPLSAVPTANGTAALAELRDNLGNTIISGLTVGTNGSGANIQIQNIAVDTTQNLVCTAGFISG